MKKYKERTYICKESSHEIGSTGDHTAASNQEYLSNNRNESGLAKGVDDASLKDADNSKDYTAQVNDMEHVILVRESPCRDDYAESVDVQIGDGDSRAHSTVNLLTREEDYRPVHGKGSYLSQTKSAREEDGPAESEISEPKNASLADETHNKSNKSDLFCITNTKRSDFQARQGETGRARQFAMPWPNVAKIFVNKCRWLIYLSAACVISILFAVILSHFTLVKNNT